MELLLAFNMILVSVGMIVVLIVEACRSYIRKHPETIWGNDDTDDM